jgi:succinate dehydrogenase flavin-adding protein (antitoxin of CptAB toxin-antitoxin module)
MQNYITKDDILDFGITIDADALEGTVAELNEKVAELVGEEIITSLTPTEAEKLADMMDDMDDDEISEWIISKVPDYPEIIENNIDIVLGEFVESHETGLEASK